MLSWLFYPVLLALLVLNFLVGGSVWTAALMVAVFAWCQYDARLDMNKADEVLTSVESVLKDIRDELERKNDLKAP